MKLDLLDSAQEFARIIEGAGDREELLLWFKKNQDEVARDLLKYGAVIFRGFQLSRDDFKEISARISPQEMPYTNGATPREKIDEGLYLASDFPKELTLPQHHEMSYMRKWPMKVFFYCDLPPESGGETPICSTRTFMERLSPRIIEKFSKLGVKYLRNYDGGIVTNWKQAFSTSDRKTVERVCIESHLDFEWKKDGNLRTWGSAQGLATHPFTNELLWHNHIINFTFRSTDDKSLPPILRMSAKGLPEGQLERWVQADHVDLPMNAYYGDGTLIEQSVLDEVNDLLEEKKRFFPWQQGDMIVIDNMLAFHGRNAYQGNRKILAILKDPYDSESRFGLSAA